MLGLFPGYIHAFYLMVSRPNKPPRQGVVYQPVSSAGPPRPQGGPQPYTPGGPQPYSQGPSQGPSQGYPVPPQSYPPPPQGYTPAPVKKNASFGAQNSEQPPPPYK